MMGKARFDPRPAAGITTIIVLDSVSGENICTQKDQNGLLELFRKAPTTAFISK
jgi:hypothetical protein